MTVNDFAGDPWDSFDLDPAALRALAEKIYDETEDEAVARQLLARADEVAMASEDLLYTYDELLGEEVADDGDDDDWASAGFTVSGSE